MFSIPMPMLTRTYSCLTNTHVSFNMLLSTFKEDFYLRVMVQYRSSPQYSANLGLDHLRATYIKP